ncbi:MAG TPA: response regulator transcription factor [Firmicutes bacterium]|nr:response regulator transcription factor [Bacillota bacterium]
MKVVIVDDHPLVRSGVEQALQMTQDLNVVGMAGDCDEGLAVIAAQKPDVVIVDLRMPGGGLTLIRQARKLISQARFIILTSYSSQGEIMQAVAENVDAYVLKGALPEELISVIRLVSQGRRYYDPEIVDMIMKSNEEDPLAQLTQREREILQELAEGKNNKLIAEKLFISENTVKKHICNILEKLELQDRTQAALFAVSHGFGNQNQEIG